jgi:hypothetical protein
MMRAAAWTAARLEIASVGLGLFLLQLEDPGVRRIGHLGEKEQVVPAEALGALPLVAVLVQALESYVVPRTALGYVPPDCAFDVADSYFGSGFLICHDSYLLLGDLCFSVHPQLTENTDPGEEMTAPPAPGDSGQATGVTARLARPLHGITRAGRQIGNGKEITRSGTQQHQTNLETSLARGPRSSLSGSQRDREWNGPDER